MKKVSLQDIASQLHVSKSLVSFVLNGQGDAMGIHPDTQDRVLAKARELSYKPHFIARGLRMGKSHTLGLIVADISNNFYARIAKRVEEVAGRHGFHLIYCSSDEDPEKEASLIQMLRDRNVDGLIISTTQQHTSIFTELKKERFPFVLIDRQLPRLRTNFVGVDNHGGGYSATTHLIENGYRSIALMKISPGYLSTVREREQGYRNAMKDGGLRVSHGWVREVGYHRLQQLVNTALDELMGGCPPVDALFSVNNSITVACLAYFRDHGIRLPQDIGIVSFDDIDLFRFNQPGITAIAQPLDAIGEEAVNILLADIDREGKAEIQQKILPVEFICRSSCKSKAAREVPETIRVEEGLPHEMIT